LGEEDLEGGVIGGAEVTGNDEVACPIGSYPFEHPVKGVDRPMEVCGDEYGAVQHGTLLLILHNK